MAVVTLIGMPGVGKTTIGKVLSKKLHYDFIDTDTLIRSRIKLNIQTFINQYGQNAFLQEEEHAVLLLKDLKNTIISTGGSIIYSAKAMTWLKDQSHVIYMHDSLSHIKSRIKNSLNRGIITFGETSLSKIYAHRKSLYENLSSLTVNVPSPFEPEKTALLIIKQLDLKPQ